ncbi:MAG: o-succinylbenzoate--CoA ligase [Ktedonobacteraceae bacterium]|nr:o-succinylbenzoate--CoA ligase [Ktedonobacteraceae bacterium]
MTSDTLLPNWLTRCSENFPQHLAIHYKDVRWTFATLEFQATRLARQLASIGVRSGSRVALLAANGLPYVACVHAITRLGAILVPLNTRLTLDELCWQLQDVKVAVLVSDEYYMARLVEIQQVFPQLTSATLIVADDSQVLLQDVDEIAAPLQPLIDPNAIQSIMYTSGTTGYPKGVLITYGMQWWNAIGSALNLGHSPDDCWLACMPFFHIGGLSILMRSVIYGISVVVQEKFDPIAVNRAIHEERVTIISVVATMLQRMLAALDEQQQDARYPSTLRCILLGGGPAPRALLEDCVRRALPVAQSYGLTEACSQAVTLSPADALRKVGSAGRPLLPVQLRIMNENRPALPDEPGTIYLKGPTITPGYADRPEATRSVFRDGWFSTGDIGYLDADGYLYVLDRRNDLIISGGENVYPAEIESVLAGHPDVEEAGVCGQDDLQWGQVAVAFVHLRSGSSVDADSILDYARQHLARYKVPRAIYFVDALPRNSAGKLLRRELRKLLL